MNWFLSILFYIVIFAQYYLIGDTLISFADYKTSLAKKMILGFFGTFFITFLVGFPAQFFRISWISYFVIQCFVFLFIDLGFLILRRKQLIRWLKRNKNVNVETIKQFVCNNWLCFVFVFLFTWFSSANNLPIYELNYDDFYYIGKMVNLVGTDHLLNENYYNGFLINLSAVPLERLFNTYELSYSFLSSVFSIDIIFFCRITMVIHNYLFFVLIYKELSSLLIPSQYSQYSVVPFFIFLIPLGYLQNGLGNLSFHICSYDLWQFQTAIFYGGSVVRVLSVPALMIFSYELIEKIDIKKILIIAMLSVAFLSFSTIFLQIFAVYSIFILLTKCIYTLHNSIKNKNIKIILFSIAGIIFILLVLLSTKFIAKILNPDAVVACIEGLNAYIIGWFDFDVILRLGIIPIIVCILISKNIQNKMIYLFVHFLYALVTTMWFKEFLALTSGNMFFVINRTVASIQFLLILIAGLCVIEIFLKFFSNRTVPSFISIVYILCICFFFQNHVDRFLDYTYLGSGISSAGWDFSRLFSKNNSMTLDIFANIGNYFNSLPYGNYTLYCPESFTYNDNETFSLGFLMSSNRIQLHAREGINIPEEKIALLNSFCLGKSNETDLVCSYLNDYELEYIVIFDENSKQLLENKGGTVVFENTKKNYYCLIKN